MIARASELFLPTLRDDPADADAVSHKLLARGGFIRQVAAGLWTFMPLGWRVHRKVEAIIREELDAFGAQEVLMPVLTPAELWEASGRIGIPELFRLKDRNGRDYILPLTHEETVAFHAREIRSYKELPQIWYHLQTKDRDEPRPRGGLLRVREFIMKDGYSFDRDAAGLDESFQKHSVAYKRIFERCGLEAFEVDAESGMMGGSGSKDFLAPSGSGENTLVTCENGDYAADLEIAEGRPSAADFPEALSQPEEVETPDQRTIEAVSQFLGVDPRATAKAMPVVVDGRVVLALVRGDDRLNEMKLLQVLGEDFRPAEAEEIREAFGASGGSIGPVGASVEVIADEALREGQYVVGANRDDVHLRGVQAGRDFEARFADLREIREGDACPHCGAHLHLQVAIEVGHIFKLETQYSEPLGATFLDEDGSEKPLIMGSYGIGPGRVVAAAVEQHHDEAGAEVLLDDRDARAGEKFADADLIGIPLRVTVGKKTLEDGAVDVRDRATGEERRIPLTELGSIA